MRPESLAICLIGRLRALHHTLTPFRKNLLQALYPTWGVATKQHPLIDVFIYSPNPSAAELVKLAPFFETQNVRETRFDDEHEVLESLSRTEEARLILRRAMRIRGNWLGSANRRLLPDQRDRRKGTGVFQMFAQDQCLDMIEKRERRRGVAYDRVMLTRTDLRWVFQHPPLSELSPHFAWVPDTGQDDWGGLYDRHLVLPRWAASHILGGWRSLVGGFAPSLLFQVAGDQIFNSNNTNTEAWLFLRLTLFGIRVARFPMTAYVACDISEWVPGSRSGEKSGPNTVHGAVHGFVCKEGHDYRYPLEYASVSHFAKCLAGGEAWPMRSESSFNEIVRDNMTWALNEAQRCYCSGYSAEVLQRHFDNFALCHM